MTFFNDARRCLVRLSCLCLLLCVLDTVAPAQLNENCTVSILNRTTRARADGSWLIDNVPATFGGVRARATCVTERHHAERAVKFRQRPCQYHQRLRRRHRSGCH